MDDELEATAEDRELIDGEQTQFSLARLDAALLTSPVVLRSIGGIVLGFAILAWPSRSDRILARIIGVGLIWLALTSVRAFANPDRRSLLGMAVTAVTLAVGAGLLLRPDQSTVALGRVIGLLLIGYALNSAYKHIRATDGEPGRLALYGLVTAAGLVLVVATEDVVSTVIAVGAIGWIVASLLILMVSLDARTSGTMSYNDAADFASDWLRDRPKSVDARQTLYAKILYDGDVAQTRIIRFFTLMGFASVIASMGIITDSTAVVIGAMLVAPLMTPLMGMAISLVMGWPNRLARSAAIALAESRSPSASALCSVLLPRPSSTPLPTRKS